MDIPENASHGTLIKYKTNHPGSYEEIMSFNIYLKENQSIFLRFEKPCFYCVSIEGEDYFSKYANHNAVLTKRKNGKWMFKGHQRLYSNEEVVFS